MAKFALISNGDTVVQISNYDAQPADVPHKNLTWLPFVASYPDYDRDTETLNPPTNTIQPTQVLRTSTVRLLTAQELDDRKEGQLSAMLKVTFEAVFNHENRIRALESKAPITKAQLKAALKAFL